MHQSNPPEQVTSTSDQSGDFSAWGFIQFHSRLVAVTQKTQTRERCPKHDGPQIKSDTLPVIVWKSENHSQNCLLDLTLCQRCQKNKCKIRLYVSQACQGDGRCCHSPPGSPLICWPYCEITNFSVIGCSNALIVELLFQLIDRCARLLLQALRRWSLWLQRRWRIC